MEEKAINGLKSRSWFSKDSKIRSLWNSHLSKSRDEAVGRSHHPELLVQGEVGQGTPEAGRHSNIAWKWHFGFRLPALLTFRFSGHQWYSFIFHTFWSFFYFAQAVLASPLGASIEVGSTPYRGSESRCREKGSTIKTSNFIIIPINPTASISWLISLPFQNVSNHKVKWRKNIAMTLSFRFTTNEICSRGVLFEKVEYWSPLILQPVTVKTF